MNQTYTVFVRFTDHYAMQLLINEHSTAALQIKGEASDMPAFMRELVAEGGESLLDFEMLHDKPMLEVSELLKRFSTIEVYDRSVYEKRMPWQVDARASKAIHTSLLDRWHVFVGMPRSAFVLPIKHKKHALKLTIDWKRLRWTDTEFMKLMLYGALHHNKDTRPYADAFSEDAFSLDERPMGVWFIGRSFFEDNLPIDLAYRMSCLDFDDEGQLTLEEELLIMSRIGLSPYGTNGVCLSRCGVNAAEAITHILDKDFLHVFAAAMKRVPDYKKYCQSLDTLLVSVKFNHLKSGS